MVRVSVVVPTVDRADAAVNLVGHLENQSIPPHEIIVVDQSPQDEARLTGRVRYHRITERGLPNARNVGAGLATGDVVLFLDDDEIPDRDLVRFHAENYEDATVAGVGGQVRGGYDAASDRVGEFHRFIGSVVRNFGSTVRRDVEHLPGGNMSFRKEVFAKIGGFDVAYGGPAMGEETDFCLRARRAGLRLVFEPRAAVEHLRMTVGGCREEKFRDWVYWHAHNSMLFALRWASAAGLPFFVAGRVIRFVLFALQHRSPALVAVGVKGLMHGIATHAKRS